MSHIKLIVAFLFFNLLVTPAWGADLVLSAGLNGNMHVGGNQVKLPTSFSFSGMAGLRFGEIITLSPELELTYLDSFKGSDPDRVSRVFQAMAGGRLGIKLDGLEPSVYLHFGAGNVSLSEDEVKRTKTGPSVEAGGALDMSILKLFMVGVQVGYVDVNVSELAANHNNLQWLRVGARASVVF